MATFAEVALQASQFSKLTTTLGTHPVNRLGQAIDALAQDFAGRPQPPTGAQVWSLAQAANLTAHLLDPAHFERLKSYSAPRMLVVDDDRDLLDAVTASLNLAHLPTTPCNDSLQALALVENNAFDLLILDVRMPGLDGPTLCNQIREIPRYWKTPILFLTVADTLDYRAQTSLCGGNDFLPKPFNAAELVIKAETWLWRNRLGPLLAAA
jgi:CheY-like chemotaxis protein